MRSDREYVDNEIHNVVTLATDLYLSIDMALSVLREEKSKGTSFDSVMRVITSLKHEFTYLLTLPILQRIVHTV